MAADEVPALTASEFVDVVYEDVYLAAARNVRKALVSPPGRQPSARLTAMHEWFVSLSESDREMLGEVVAFAGDHAVFGLLCLLDNVQPVVDGYRETLELRVRSDQASRTLSREGEELHGMFRSRVDEGSGWDG